MKFKKDFVNYKLKKIIKKYIILKIKNELN